MANPACLLSKEKIEKNLARKLWVIWKEMFLWSDGVEAILNRAVEIVNVDNSL